MTGGPLQVRFPSEDGGCGGDLYLPARPAAGDGAEGRGRAPPVVVMAHGIAAERAFGLERFARRFAERGLAALTFDYRGFGDSSGEPRYLVSPRRHIADYRAAVDFVRGHDAIDGDRIALWGTSFSGGHVLEVAARRPDGLRAVVSQIPFVSGIASTLVYPLRYQVPALVMAIADGLGALLGREPLAVPVVRERGLALLPGSDARTGYEAMIPSDTQWPGRVPARVFLSVLAYRPLSVAPEVGVPTLIVAARNDAICPIGAARKAARRIPDHQLEELPIGHFEAYFDPWFDRVAELEAGFLETELAGSEARPRPS